MEKLGAANNAAIKHYVKTGDYDPNDRNWPGQNFVEALTNAGNSMREGLIAAVLKRAPRVAQLPTQRPGGTDARQSAADGQRPISVR